MHTRQVVEEVGDEEHNWILWQEPVSVGSIKMHEDQIGIYMQDGGEHGDNRGWNIINRKLLQQTRCEAMQE